MWEDSEFECLLVILYILLSILPFLTPFLLLFAFLAIHATILLLTLRVILKMHSKGFKLTKHKTRKSILGMKMLILAELRSPHC